jgi:multidrug resistance efflux pump
MSAGAGVTSLDVLHDWYAAVAQCRTEAQNALIDLSLSLQRAASWLDEQEHYWHRQIQACEEEVTQAKAELTSRRFTGYRDQPPDCTVQEKNLRKAQAHLEAAEDRLKAVRRWMVKLPREVCATYDGPAGRLALFLDGELPAGLALLARQLTALEQYANLQAESAPALDKEKS